VRVANLARPNEPSLDDAGITMSYAFTVDIDERKRFEGSRFYTWLVHILTNESLMNVRQRRLNSVRRRSIHGEGTPLPKAASY
jgi:hypothetical protein